MLEDESVSIQRVGKIVKEVLNIIDEDAPASALAGIKQQFKKNNNYLFFFHLCYCHFSCVIMKNMSMDSSPTLERYSMGSVAQTEKDATKSRDNLGLAAKLTQTSEQVESRVKMGDEYRFNPAVKIDVRGKIIIEVKDISNQTQTKDLTESVKREFQYLSSTQGLEINTDRTNILQDYVDKMIGSNQDWEGKVRVVIMNRGKEPRAFAYPDGTICISQSLINLYDSLDEVMAVLAHEVGHLINGTTKAAFRANVYKRNSLGVKWLHETTSDFISCELLEKLGLKSTAQADVLSKLAKHSGNNNRGIEHQAPVLRATETLGVHAIKDFETSHLEYTPLPAELSKEVTKTNFELILAATGENDFEAIEEYLPNLHPRDFGEYFDLAMTGNFWRIESQLGLTSLKKETIDGVVKRVKLLTSKRLMEEGLSEKEIKLFFFSVLSDSNVLYPKFKDFAELEDHAAVARKMSQENLVNKMIDKLFDKPNFYGMDLLILLVSLVENDFSKLTDEDLHSLIDISEFTSFVLAVHQQIAAELPNIDGVDFVDENGKVLDVTSYNSIYDVKSGRITIPILIQNNLEKMIFNYIYNYYLPQIESYGLELDQSQIEDIFQFLKEKGFIIMGNRSYFPYYYDKSVKLIDEKYLTVIEKAYQNVFGERLVKEAEKTEVLSLPSLEQFRQSIEGRGVLQILEIFNKNEIISQKVDEKMATNYTQVVLDYLDQRDYFNSRLNALLMMGENYYGSALDEETCNQIIEKKGLNKEALYQEARQRAELDRFADKVYFLSRSIAPFENKFFDFVESITEQFPYDLNDYDHFQLVVMCKPMLEMIEGDRFHMAGKITNLDRFSELKIVQETMNKLKSPHFESLADLQLYIKDILNIYKQSSSATPPGLNEKIALYEDNIFSVLLMKPVRDELLRLSRPENVSKKDFPVLIDLINSYFPYSPQKTGLIREIQKSFLSDKQIPIQEKIDLFFEKYRLFGYEGAVLVAEQITDLDTYRFFRERLNALGQDYISGNKDLSLVAGVDIISSMLNMKADSLIKTVSNDQKIARETSTDLAMYWVDLCFNQANEHVKYDADTGKIILSDEGRTKFITLKDCFDDLKALSDGKKTLIALKALSDQNGLLVTEGGRKLLEKMMLNGLDLESDFFRIVLSQAVKNGDAKVLGLPASQMLAPFLFRSLNVDAVNLFRLRNHDMYTRSTNLDEDIWEKIKTKDYSADLPKILSSGTRDIRFFGYKYYHQPDSAISLQAQEAGQTYFDTLENLQKLVIEEEKDLNQEQHGYISPSTEAIIKAGETSPIFVRSMQMAVQIKNFSPAVQERLSHTQDSMHGMEKLRFWDNLLSKAENDSQLADFLENDLISLDSYLGGGSLFTTYGATIRGKDGNQQKIVIKMLNPNAEEFIHMSYDFSSEVLAQAEQESGGKTKQDIKFANSLLELSKTWCIKDINDDVYPELDDLFHSTAQSYNQDKGKVLIELPGRIQATKKIKVEALYPGVTLNKFLAKENVSAEKKREVVQDLLDFFDYQFTFSPRTTTAGQKEYIFHSDPHTGNYMIDVEAPSQRLGVIDRSLYISLKEEDVNILKLLKVGENLKFIRSFTDKCLELSQTPESEAKKIRSKISVKLVSEAITQSLKGEKNDSAYLQIILQEFAQYGEKYSVKDINSANLDRSKLQKNQLMIIDYLKDNPNVEISVMYDVLKNLMLNGTKDSIRQLTFAQFKKIVSNMFEDKILFKKTIEVPLEYRLMIRNIVAMKNLKKKWT